MDQKVLFIADHLRGHYSHSELCARFGISRKTGYKWISRYRESALLGLEERTRRPHHSPLTTPYVVREAILKLRRQASEPLGAKKIAVLLGQWFDVAEIPSHTTIYNILNAEELIPKKKRRQRVSPYPQPFAPVNQVNELWSVDYKGHFKLGDGQYCYPLTTMDSHSRYLLGCQGERGTGTEAARRHFERLFRRFGLPRRIRSDNGVPFASQAAGGLSSLSVWWIRLGILPERIEPGKPQQNGKHERMHRTLKRQITRPLAKNLKQQQERFDAFVDYYNQKRPHEALGQNTPASRYQRSTREYPDKLPELEYPRYFELRKVGSNGVVYMHNGQVYVSGVLRDQVVGLEQVEDGVWDVYFGPIRLGSYNERTPKGQNTAYWSLHV